METRGQDTRSLVLRLLEERAEAIALVGTIRAANLGHAPPKELWLASTGAIALMAADLDWLEPRERGWVWACVGAYLVRALTESRTEDWPTDSEVESAILAYLNWLKSQPDRTVVRFCWDILAFRPRPRGSYTSYPVHWLSRGGRLTGEASYKMMECAITLADEAEAMFWWPNERWQAMRWERDSQVYIDFVSNSGYLVRATAAKALGELFWGCSKNDRDSLPPKLADVMTWIQSQEQRRAGVAGPFLDGSHWSGGDLMKAVPEYDFRTWLLKTLSVSSEEPAIPHVQTLEFYAHEFFCADGDAIQAMLQMGRYRLAVWTATEEPAHIDRLKAVLDSMAQSDLPGVSPAIRTYLIERQHHAGLELMQE